MAKSVILFMLLLHVLASALATKFSSLNLANECSMLFQFKLNMSVHNYASSDPHAYPKVASWKLNGSEGAGNCCLWDGVECRSGHVIGLDLSSSYLYGTIHSNSSLFNLIQLQRLNLADNNFHLSRIPSGIGRFSQLANLNLSYSVFSGEVPKQISHLSNLVSLDLTGNRLKLDGSDFQNLVQNSSESLTELFLSEVNIDSEVPDSLVNSSLLTSLVMRNCGLVGEFPTGIFNLQTLQVLDVQRNVITVSIPELYGNNELKYLNMAETIFLGDLPASIGNLTHLNMLNLSTCGLKGTVPASISNLTQLTVLDLGYNFFSGPFPQSASLSKLNYLKLAGNFDRSNHCDWLGMLPNLSYLDVQLSNLNCEIPSSIGNLTQLRELYLGGNGMTGQIPSSFTNLTLLTALYLYNNKFTGSLPSLENFSNLTYLSLQGNKFDSWKLPDWLGKLKKITYLDLTDVNLYGEIPSSFFNLTQLRTLDLSINKMKGQLPSSLLNLQNLEFFNLPDNYISGTLEFDLFLSLKKLKYLHLDGNKITHSVIYNHTNDTQPNFVELSLTSCNLKVFPEFLRFQHELQSLYLDDNIIEGVIPGWMWNISKETLVQLSLSRNHLMGFEQHSPIAPWVSLQTLDLRDNMLHGSIPVPPPTTNNFFVSNNRLTGEIPPSICALLSLQLLDMSFNNITGSIPPCLEKISNSLSVLNLRSNNLQGTIPNIFTNESKLEMISLSKNKLEGQVPRSLENCESLQILDLGYNFLEDIFPFWLGKLPELQVLILSFNRFHGIIRTPSKIKVNFPKLRIIDLSNNLFCGNLPDQYFQQWSAMNGTEETGTYMQTYISVVQNEFYMWVGNYSFSIEVTNRGVKREYEKIISILFAVDFSSNKFTGKIPESIETLSSLQLLDISKNELSGGIPPLLGRLGKLESLDLSCNKLSGMIPPELIQLNFLAFLNVSNNNLTGRIPQGGQFYTFLNNSYSGNQALCGEPLSMKCGDSTASKPPKVSSKEDTEPDFPNGIDWVVIFCGFSSGLVIGLIFGNHLTTRFYNWFLIRFKK